MKSPKITLAVAAALTFGGCASTKDRIYRLEAGARHELHDESPDIGLDQTLTQMAGTPVTATEGNPNKVYVRGYGGQLGLAEYGKRVVSRISAFYTKFEPVSYAFQVQNSPGRIQETLNASVLGLDASLGFPIWRFFSPHVSWKYQRLMMDAEIQSTASSVPASTSSYSQWQFLLGGGLNIDLPITKGVRLVLDADYRIPLNTTGGSIAETTFQAGFRFWNWKLK